MRFLGDCLRTRQLSSNIVLSFTLYSCSRLSSGLGHSTFHRSFYCFGHGCLAAGFDLWLNWSCCDHDCSISCQTLIQFGLKYPFIELSRTAEKSLNNCLRATQLSFTSGCLCCTQIDEHPNPALHLLALTSLVFQIARLRHRPGLDLRSSCMIAMQDLQSRPTSMLFGSNSTNE